MLFWCFSVFCSVFLSKFYYNYNFDYIGSDNDNYVEKCYSSNNYDSYNFYQIYDVTKLFWVH